MAAKKHPLPTKEVKERSKRLSSLFNEIAVDKNKEWEGWEGEVLIDEKGKGNSMIGRNYAYKQVVLDENHKLGDKIEVKIKKAERFHLLA